jgi:predicted Zn-dependent protease
LRGYNIPINGVRVDEYNMLVEAGQSPGDEVATAIHEMGHVLGAPDFYTVAPDLIAPAGD